ncbi:MAG: 4-hydroxy-3-methylbut-2-enyl diphosphate reductase [Dehalococcoidia bacterium]
MVHTLHLAKPRGFCAGVVMAIDAVEEAAEGNRQEGRGDLSVYHAIVHNDTVVRRLEDKHAIHFVEDLDELERVRSEVEASGGSLDSTVVFSAHGVAPTVRQRAHDVGLTTIDATCPLVTKVHSESKRYARDGYHILLIGDSTKHQEVIGTYGEAPEATTVVAVLDVAKDDPALADPRTVEVPDPERVAVLTQTTLSVDDTNRTIDLLRTRFPKLVRPSRDDLCYATKNRQDAVRSIAAHVDAFVVVTSAVSSNGMRLLDLAQRETGRAMRIESPDDLDAARFEGVGVVGVTSAASTPDDLVQDVVRWFRARNEELRVVEEGAWENIAFRKPKRVSPPAADPARP